MRRKYSSFNAGNLRPAIIGIGRILGVGLSHVAAAPLSSREHHHDGDESGGHTPLWIMAVASLALTLIGGVFAGLTIA